MNTIRERVGPGRKNGILKDQKKGGLSNVEKRVEEIREENHKKQKTGRVSKKKKERSSDWHNEVQISKMRQDGRRKRVP